MSIFNTWRVSVFSRNMTDGESENTFRTESEREARAKYRDWVANYGNNNAVKCCAVYLYNPDGLCVKDETIDNRPYITAE